MNSKFYVTLSQAKRLKELGVVQKSEAWWYSEFMSRPLVNSFDETTEEPEWKLIYGEENIPLRERRGWKGMYTDKLGEYAAFSVGELGAMLYAAIPRWVAIWNEWGYAEHDGTKRGYTYEAEARAQKLIHIIEHEMISIEAINARYLEAIKE